MAERRAEEVVLPPPPPELRQQETEKADKPDVRRRDEDRTSRTRRLRDRDDAPQHRPVRKATLRLVQVEPWSVMKTAFLLSVALGIVTVVAVAIVWTVLGAAGLWDSVNSMVQQTLGDDNGTPFQVQDYLGTSRVMGFTMLVAVADVVLITAIATLGAFLYNLTATLVGGVEVTFAEDR